MKLKLRKYFIFLPWLFIHFSCKEASRKLFVEVSPEHSHVNFKNEIQEDIAYNILTYEYLYNGGGVAVGDVNNDGLPDIMFTGNMTPNKLYLNKGNFQFEDITDKAGVAGRNRWKTGVVMADVNGDGLMDIYVCYSGPGTDADRSNELYINNGIKNGIPTFTECAKKYGLDAPGTYTTSVAFFDMDNDGDLDMFMVNHGDMFYNPFFNTDKLRSTRDPRYGNRLYRNDNGHFTDVSEQAHINGSGLNFGLSVAISDVNNDGWPDIYVTNDYSERDFLYLNNKDGTFREVLAKAAGHTSEFAMGSDIADYNNDGLEDIMVLDMLPEDNHRQKLLRGADDYDKYNMLVDHGYGHQQMRNTLQLNNGIDSAGIPIFSEVGQMAGVSNTDWSWSPLFADFDNDGWKDLFISNGILRDMTNQDFVKYTSGYSDHYIRENGHKGEMWELVQSMPSTKLNNYLFHNEHSLGFTNVTSDWGLTKAGVHNGAAYADLNNDGNLDLVINNLNSTATIYRNNLSSHKEAHYLRIKFGGNNKNTSGIGAKVYVKTAHNTQYQEQYFNRGFQSSVDPVMHIGLGKDSIIRLLRIAWPGGGVSTYNNIRADTLLVANQNDAIQNDAFVKPSPKSMFADVTASSGINFTHRQSTFVDFKIAPLLPFQLSKIGPCIAKADVNGDGLEDVFIGASAGQESQLYLQTKEGNFLLSKSQPWNNNKNITNADALFFDADGDGHPDLYLVSGGDDYPLNSPNYQDRIFENDGQGNFAEVKNALPLITTSGSCVRAGDIDNDGLHDLFIGGRFVPGMFPEAPTSYILKNKSTRGHILFERDLNQTDKVLNRPGMVTDALWIDLNKDGWQDLVVVGQFMPITIFENHNGKLAEATKAYGLSETNGWWTRILAEDFDRDGQVDFIVGNLGENTQYKASENEPLTITYGDFDHDGVIDPILCYFIQHQSYPVATRDELFNQMPSLHKKFQSYASYADAQLGDLFSRDELAASKTVKIDMLQSVFLRNEGNKKFKIIPLPERAQISMINGITSLKNGQSGYDDLLIAGNFYPWRVSQGPLDAGIGLFLKNDGKGNFTPGDYSQTGLCIPGDVRNILTVKSAKGLLIVAVKNGGAVQVLRKTE
jgi:hypothetical protein